MEDIQLALTASRVEQKNFGIWLKNWQVGQMLQALVTGQRPSGELLLRVGSMQMTATSDIPVQPGATLMLEVRRLQPVPLLRLMEIRHAQPDPELTAAVASRAAGRPQSWGALVELFQALFVGRLALPPPALPPPAQDALARLQRVARDLSDLTTPTRLRSALTDSGIFYEAKLAAGYPQAALQGDFKAALLRWMGVLTALRAQGDAPAGRLDQLLAQADAVLAVLTRSQLASLPVEVECPRLWHCALPIAESRRFSLLDLRIERDAEAPQAESLAEPVWCCTLDLSLPRAGPLNLKIGLQGSAVRVSAVHEHADVRQALLRDSATLQSALAARGLQLLGFLAQESPVAPALDSNPEQAGHVDARA
jgi:hypothetical protein